MFATKVVSAVKGLVNGSNRPKQAGPLFLHLTALLLFLLCFTGVALMSFPQTQLRNYAVGLIYRQTGQPITIGELSLSPLLRVKAKDISWQPKGKDWQPIVVDRLSLSPFWTSLFDKNPAGSFRASIAGGTVEGWASKIGSFSAELAGVNLAPFFTAGFPFPPSGKISGTVAAERQAGSGAAAYDFELAAEDLRVAGLDTLGLPEGGLALGRIKFRGKMKGRSLTVEELQNEGGDLSLAVRGTILIGARPGRSRLNLRVEIQPGGAALTPAFRDLLSLTGLKPDPEGGYKFRLAGTLTRPILR